jgi:predicted Zn-dependent protease
MMVVESLLEIADKAIKTAVGKGVSQAQATAFLIDVELTRFANSQIHQNVGIKDGGMLVKVILDDKRIGILRANTLDETEIGNAVKQAVEIAKVSQPNKDFKSLPEPEPWKAVKGAFDHETASCTPEHRAQKVKEAIETAHSESPKVRAVAGYISTNNISFAVANSLGVSASAQLTTANMKTTVISRENGSEGFGAAQKYSRRVSDINPTDMAREAAEKSVKSLNPARIPLNEYGVILSPLAVGTIFRFLAYIGFSARSFQDGRSFIKYHLNKRVFDEKLNLKDDARDSRTFYAMPVDGEGVPKRSLHLIENGVVSEESVCYDSFTAGRENKKSTGHSLPPLSVRYFGGTLPFNMIVEPGDSSLEEMIEETREGIFVTFLHYINPVEPTKAVLTGLTRDGTFLIQDGEITKPVVNMRFTDSMLSALNEIQLIGRNSEIVGQTTVSPMKLRKLRFVGHSAY